MRDNQIDDLKQFIDSRISQSEARTEESIGIVRNDTGSLQTDMGSLRGEVGGIKTEIHGLRAEMRQGFLGVAEVIEEFAAQFDERLTKLEK